MKQKTAMTYINILKNIISVYFDTFFVFYFFKVANYEVIPLAKYYLTLYFWVGIGFYMIRWPMKNNLKIPFFRWGISLQALYISLIMILKENIIHCIFFVGIIKGLAEALYSYPKNIMSTEVIDNDGRQKYDGITNIVNKITEILIPLLLGILLTKMSYVDLGKIFFLLFIVMFILTFWLKDNKYEDRHFSIKKFNKKFKNDKNIKYVKIATFLSGFTFSSGVMGTIITLSKIYNFKTNLNLGYVDSICAIMSLITGTLFALKIKKKDFNKIIVIAGILSFIILIMTSFIKSRTILIIYLFARNSIVDIIYLIANNKLYNYSNSRNIAKEYKAEFYCIRDLLLATARCSGYIILLLVCLHIGKEYINYILLIPAVSLLIESIVISKIKD